MAHKDVFIDIETLPAIDWSDEEIADHVRGKVPGNYKSDEATAKWVKENTDSVFGKTALNPTLGFVWMVAVRIAVDGKLPIQPAKVFVAHYGPNRMHLRKDEESMLDDLDEYLENMLDGGDRVFMVGHNLKAFDRTWLVLRALRYDQRALSRLCLDATAIDTMELAGIKQSRVSHTVTLDAMCRWFGIDGKGDMTGADVYPAWRDGRVDEVSAYCAADVDDRLIPLYKHLAPVRDLRKW